MGVSISVTKWLRQNGYDATHLIDESLQTLSDELIFEKAEKENRIILTFDLDFGEILSKVKAKQPSVVIFRLENQTPLNVIRHMQNITANYTSQLSEGVTLLVTEHKYRIRRLPIK
jgi:predicted nuclease of predicted toxin-antitoxin system